MDSRGWVPCARPGPGEWLPSSPLQPSGTVRILLLVLLSAVTLSGCFSFQEASDPQLGSHVRITLPVTSRPDSAGAAPEALYVQGPLLATSPAFAVEQKSTREFSQFRKVTVLDTAYVPLEDARVVEVRRLDWMRTGIMGVGGYFLVASLYRYFRP
jgi:hypothetical protein